MYNFITVTANGKITTKGVVQAQDFVILKEGEIVIPWESTESVSFEDDYFDGAAVVPRPPYPAHIERIDPSEVKITNLPQPTKVTIEAIEYEIADGEITLTADVGASYKIECNQWPYLDWETVIELEPVL